MPGGDEREIHTVVELFSYWLHFITWKMILLWSWKDDKVMIVKMKVLAVSLSLKSNLFIFLNLFSLYEQNAGSHIWNPTKMLKLVMICVLDHWTTKLY